MKISLLFLIKLIVYAQAKKEKFNWKGCGMPGLPYNTEIFCSSSHGCNIICSKGYQFSNGQGRINIWCDHGLWRYHTSTTLPQCKALTGVCVPSCQNGGKCDHLGVCRCLRGFSGVACEIEMCNIRSVFDGGYKCSGCRLHNHYKCKTKCPGDKDWSTHTCDYDTGIWSPPFTSKCFPDTSKCIIDPPGRDWSYSCVSKRLGKSCDVWCTQGDEVTHTCDHRTGIWTPPLRNCTAEPKDGDVWKNPEDPGHFHWENCTMEGLPDNSAINCNSISSCKSTCNEGYKFSTGADHIMVDCNHGHWTWGPTSVLPTCQPVCSPSCQNSGECYRPGKCYCTKEFVGSQCQYRRSNCDIYSVDTGYGAARCRMSSQQYKCSISCRGHTTTHTCDYRTGRWTPPTMKCYE